MTESKGQNVSTKMAGKNTTLFDKTPVLCTLSIPPDQIGPAFRSYVSRQAQTYLHGRRLGPTEYRCERKQTEDRPQAPICIELDAKIEFGQSHLISHHNGHLLVQCRAVGTIVFPPDADDLLTFVVERVTREQLYGRWILDQKRISLGFLVTMSPKSFLLASEWHENDKREPVLKLKAGENTTVDVQIGTHIRALVKNVRFQIKTQRFVIEVDAAPAGYRGEPLGPIS